MTPTTRAHAIAGTVLVALVALTACGPDPVHVPSELLSAKTVGGTALGDAHKHIGGNAGVANGSPSEQCSLDDVNLLLGASDDVAMAYRRTVDGHRETVVIGANDTTPNTFTTGRQHLERGLAGKGCRRPPTIDATAVDLGLDGTTAFSSARHAGTKHEESILRSYTLVHENGYSKLVLISIERTDGSAPSTSELKELTTAQLDKTRTKLNG